MTEFVGAVINEIAFLRSLGNNQIFFMVEVHVTKSKFDELCENYGCVTTADVKYFMGCPIVIDESNFVCTVHKKEIIL